MPTISRRSNACSTARLAVGADTAAVPLKVKNAPVQSATWQPTASAAQANPAFGAYDGEDLAKAGIASQWAGVAAAQGVWTSATPGTGVRTSKSSAPTRAIPNHADHPVRPFKPVLHIHRR
ncbi:hypothetical protein GCM10008024_02370 [Allgaiera indica]|uniref:Uncharacterized protein n=1 Tax=Allgaiera indica TaxID=765699 RepID=A0AAN4ZXC3_9RHOB|nr:hypothetical protein GCM10008024_02370 [Allgaiera indica]